MSEEIRKVFESMQPKPKGVYFDELSGCYSPKSSNEFETAAIYNGMFVAFQSGVEHQQKRIDDQAAEIERLKQMIDLGLGWGDLAGYNPDKEQDK